MKISEMITDRYKLRIPPTVYYDLLADVQEAEEEQEPCDKYIKEIDHLRKYIYKLETQIVEQEPRKGHWISHGEHCEMNNLRPSGLGSYFWCSECNCGIDSRYFHRVNYKYCPNCGRKME